VRARPPVLEVITHVVAESSRGRRTLWEPGRLTVSETELKPLWTGLPGVLGVELHVVRPGDPVRLVNVLDAVEPTIKVESPMATFPGALGACEAAGAGKTRRLAGLAVIGVANIRASHEISQLDVVPDGDAVIDMAGPAADYSYWSSTQNLVLCFDCDPSVHLPDVDRSIRRATLECARALAGQVPSEAGPDDVETFSLGPAEDAPPVCVILQVAAEGPLVDTYLYGASLKGAVPTVLDPREVLDGALTAGQYDWAGVRNPTHFYQRSDLLLRLLRAHGSDVDLRGVVLTLAYLPSAAEKERMAMMAAKLARQLGCGGAILTTFSSGNSQTDTMLTCRACEHLGIRTVALLAETNAGLTDHVPEADALVSVGNEEELLPPWEPDEVIGGDVLLDGQPATEPRPLPLVSYLGALCQMGDMRVRATSA
jgi:sarcosine reductase